MGLGEVVEVVADVEDALGGGGAAADRATQLSPSDTESGSAYTR